MPQMLRASFSPEIYKKVEEVISEVSMALGQQSEGSGDQSLHPVVVILPTVNNVFLLLQLDDGGMKEFMVWAKDKQVAISDNFCAIQIMLDETEKTEATLSISELLEKAIATASQAVLNLVTADASEEKKVDSSATVPKMSDPSPEISDATQSSEGASALAADHRSVQ